MKRKIGVVGYGNMGSAIANQLASDYRIYVFDKDKEKTNNLRGLWVADNVVDLARQVAIIVLAIKPQDFATLLREIEGSLRGKLIISLAAGIPTEYIEKCLPGARVVRAMPNIGIKIKQSVTCLAKGVSSSDNDLVLLEGLFNALGVTKKIEEKMMDAATAISGSGPAYICDYIESHSLDLENIPKERKEDFLTDFQKTAENIGFTRDEAAFLVQNTFTSTLNMLQETGLSPWQLKKQVASKGGTTEAALEVLHQGGSLEEAVKTARRRAEELRR